MKSKIIKSISLTIIALAFTACNNDGYDEYTPGKTPSEAMNGEWVIDVTNAATGELLSEHITHRTYDTNGGDNKMFIDDIDEESLKGTVNVNLSNLTFSSTDSENIFNDGEKFTITEGKVLKNAAHTAAGNATDSIYFKVVFSDVPTETLIYSGYKKTGFVEDL